MVSGEVPSVVNEENEHKTRVKEMVSDNSERAVRLRRTSEIDVNNIKAEYTGSILKLGIPKLEPTESENNMRRITINSQDEADM